MKQAMFDWCGLETAAVNHMIAAVRQIRDTYPQEQLYGAIFHGFYGDGSCIGWPCLAVGSEESLASVTAHYQMSVDDLRWSPADLPHNVDQNEESEQWAEACCEFASLDGTYSAWEKIYDRFLHIFPQAAKKARQQLLRDGIVDKDFIAIASDEAGKLIPLSLTKAQILRYFPEYDAAEQERQYLATLPLEQRLTALIAQIFGTTKPGLLYDEYEQLLKASGIAAIPSLAAIIGNKKSKNAWKACMLLAEINEPTEEAIAALTEKLDDGAADSSDRSWAASALARLGRMDLLAERVLLLPIEIVASGLAAPYRAFRDRGRHLPLNYQQLELVLAQYPQVADAVAHELKPGSSYCKITAGEEPAARAGLESSWTFIRRHAEDVLEVLEDKL